MPAIYGKYSSGFSETIAGSSGDDTIYPLGGWDTVDAGAGIDTVVIAANASAFKISSINGTTYVDAISSASSYDSVMLRNTEYIKFNDTTVSLIINDIYKNTPGSDNFDGGPGRDTVEYLGIRANFSVTSQTNNRAIVQNLAGTEGSDYLISVERLQFADAKVALDLGPRDCAGQAVLLIGAVLGKELTLAKKELMGTVIGLFDEGYDMGALAGALMRLPIWAGVLTPTNSKADIAAYLFRVTNGHEPSNLELQAAVAQMGAQVEGAYLASLAASAANQLQVDLVGLAAKGFEYV